MKSLLVRDIPDDVHAELRRRAAAGGQSLQEFLLQVLTSTARTEPLETVLERAAQRSGGSLPSSFAVKALRAERDRR